MICSDDLSSHPRWSPKQWNKNQFQIAGSRRRATLVQPANQLGCSRGPDIGPRTGPIIGHGLGGKRQNKRQMNISQVNNCYFCLIRVQIRARRALLNSSRRLERGQLAANSSAPSSLRGGPGGSSGR